MQAGLAASLLLSGNWFTGAAHLAVLGYMVWPDGTLALVDLYGAVATWRRDQGLVQRVPPSPSGPVDPFISRDGRVMRAQEVTREHVWDLHTRACAVYGRPMVYPWWRGRCVVWWGYEAGARCIGALVRALTSCRSRGRPWMRSPRGR